MAEVSKEGLYEGRKDNMKEGKTMIKERRTTSRKEGRKDGKTI
jgi:hypothetical protein